MPSQTPQEGIRIAIDRGGTFCDFWARIPGRPQDLVLKLLSVCPAEYQDAPTEGIRRILETATGTAIPPGTPLDLTPVESIRMGTTVATNALLERKGERVALLITRGFRDLLLIGNQSRPRLFDLAVRKLDRLFETVVEVDARVTVEGASEDPNSPVLTDADVAADPQLVRGTNGEVLRCLRAPDLAAVRADLDRLWQQGFRSIAVALMHAYNFPDHELAIGQLARSMGFQVSLSSQLQSMINLVPRAQSAVADAYLSPITQDYLESFRRGFAGALADDSGHGHKLLLSQSHGGLVHFRDFSGLRAILSGPAGGVLGYAKTCFDPDEGTPVLGFDMGGTSTDVSRYGGTLEHVFETTIAEVPIQCPQLDVNTVAAGGGSILSWSHGLFRVGPDSAGALPGPACYGNGGPLTITDANCFLGRILPQSFPRKLDIDSVRTQFLALTDRINADTARESSSGAATAARPLLTPEEVAIGFIQVANATMARPIRSLSEGRGFEAAAHNLASFGGAGGQHAVAIARDLGIRRVLIHRLSSILSAYGMALADIVVETQEPEALVYAAAVTADGEPVTAAAAARDRVTQRFALLAAQAARQLEGQGIAAHRIRHECFLNMRYRGSDTTLMIQEPADGRDFAPAFVERHRREFGFTQQRDILVDDVRVRSIGSAMELPTSRPLAELRTAEDAAALPRMDTTACKTQKMYFSAESGWIEAPVLHLAAVPLRHRVRGPAILYDDTQTILLDLASTATMLDEHLVIDLDLAAPHAEAEAGSVGQVSQVDPIKLSIFGHRLMSVAEQMGRTLQKTSISTNIKERLDYSCAVFSAAGGLVANAPHIPGHLGSMSTGIRYQADKFRQLEQEGKDKLRPGDVILSNHPCAGGTHLPDLTVITPVFDDDANPTEIMFFVANRGHHADIGGILAGSMPPNSTELWQEGAAIETFKLVKHGGVFDEQGLIEELYVKPAQYPGCSGTRTLHDNIADLKASVAANHRGIVLIQELARQYSWPVVRFYMEAIQKNAEMAVRAMLKQLSARFRGRPLKAIDWMDDGTQLSLEITIDPDTGSAKFDFAGTGLEAFNNLNTPSAVMFSGIIYCLRCMVSSDIPLNQGCLVPIEVCCPPNTLLSPSLAAATVGSNVETSQRIVDLILKAFRVCGASQGTCNNLTFGYGGTETDEATGTTSVVRGFGYYETIAGGAGAGPSWDGQSGVHTNVTNTRITDPEVLEKRYPVLLHEFSIRHGSGGLGRRKGGDGCIRDLEFRRPLQVSILSERRVIPPYGMAGGGEGGRGLNVWVRRDDADPTNEAKTRRISLGGKATVPMKAGDRIIVMTPGGGGYGKCPELEDDLWFADEPVQESSNGFSHVPRAAGSVGARESLAASN